MATEKQRDLIDRKDLIKAVEAKHFALADNTHHYEAIRTQGKYFREVVDNAPTVDAVEVVHGRWERCGGDLHSSGYAIFCSVCNKVHFVHRKYSLGGLNCKELFEKPKYCPSCGAVMESEE